MRGAGSGPTEDEQDLEDPAVLGADAGQRRVGDPLVGEDDLGRRRHLDRRPGEPCPQVDHDGPRGAAQRELPRRRGGELGARERRGPDLDGLGERERRDAVTCRHRGQPGRLLLVCSVSDQHLPGDDWDEDYTHERTLLRTAVRPDPKFVKWINPTVRPNEQHDIVVAIGEAGGIFMLDRNDGKFLWATPFPADAPQFVLSDIDVKTGRTVINWNNVFKTPGENHVICFWNTRSYWPTAYSPVTNSLYTSYIDNCRDFTLGGRGNLNIIPRPGSNPNELTGLAKIDLTTGKILRFDVGNRGDLAKPKDIAEFAIREIFLHQVLASGLGLNRFAPIQPHDVGDELNLLRRPLPVRPVNLAEDMACVDEQHLILALRALLSPVEEP